MFVMLHIIVLYFLPAGERGLGTLPEAESPILHCCMSIGSCIFLISKGSLPILDMSSRLDVLRISSSIPWLVFLFS